MKLTDHETVELEDLTHKAKSQELTGYESVCRTFLANKKLVDPSQYEELREWYEDCMDSLKPYLGGGGDDW
jgi:hypothetical protein